MIFGAVKPGSASLPVIAISRSLPIVSRISVALGLGALVVPQDRGTQDLVVAVQRDQPVHLSGEPHRLDVVARDPAAASTPRIGLRPPRPTSRRGSCSLHSGCGVSNVYSGQAAAWTAPSGVEQHRLRGGGRDVEPQDVAHRVVLVATDDPPLAVGRHLVPRDLAQRTERLHLAELVAHEDLHRRASRSAYGSRPPDVHALLEHLPSLRYDPRPRLGRDPDLQPASPVRRRCRRRPRRPPGAAGRHRDPCTARARAIGRPAVPSRPSTRHDHLAHPAAAA